MDQPDLRIERQRFARRVRRRRVIGLALAVVGAALFIASGSAYVWFHPRQLHGTYRPASGNGYYSFSAGEGGVMAYRFEPNYTPAERPGTWQTMVLQRDDPRNRAVFRGVRWLPRIAFPPSGKGGGVAIFAPFWLPGVLGLGLGGVAAWLLRRVDSSRCARCRYLLTGLSPQTTRCPECGHVLGVSALMSPREHAADAETIARDAEPHADAGGSGGRSRG